MSVLLRVVLGAGLHVALGACCSCASPRSDARAAPPRAAPPASVPLPALADDTPRNYPGIHNAVAYHEGFVSGSAPEGEAGFDTLAAMGIRTIVSVDGAEPEVQRAAARGIRYVHLPIGYNGFDQQRKLQLVRAVRDASQHGPVYIHCHHGKHRSAAAAATIAASLGWLSPAAGVERMRVSGTARNYPGLYTCASAATVVLASEIDRVPADLPPVWKPSDFVKGMLEIDAAFEGLKAIENAGWTTPRDHPDLVPAAEAGRLADLFRVLSETDDVARRPAAFSTIMHEANAASQTLENLLAAGETNAIRLGAPFELIAASCRDCHARFRD